MLLFSLAFLLGDLLIQCQSRLPPSYLLVIAALTGALCLIIKRRSRIIVAGLLLGFAFTGLSATKTLSWQLPTAWENKKLIARGIVHSMPVRDTYGTHFVFKVLSLQNQDQTILQPALVRLSFHNNQVVHAGDRFQFQVKLKRIHGLQNPGGFNYEAWAFHNHLLATGNISTKSVIHHDGHDYLHAPLEQIRQYLRKKIINLLPDSEVSPWLLALTIGERGMAPPEHWQILRATGTNHLMAIAGLHIGLIAGLVYTLMQFFWRRSDWLLALYPAQLAASLASLVTAWLYSALAGFSIPTQRACIMVTFILIAKLLRRSLPAWHAWSAALLTVLLLNPLSVLSESFWLSFATLALIIYGMHGRLSPQGLWWKWGRVQAVISVGLIPFSFLFFQQTSLASILANCIAIPWLAILILPFCLFSLLFLNIYPPLASALLWIADFNLQYLWKVLAWFAHLPLAVWSTSMPSNWVLFTSIIACLLFLMPRSMPGRVLGVIWLLPLLLYHPDKLQPSNFTVTILDIGQGLSVIVQTQTHVLVYDTGPKFGPQFDMGESVVLPFLRMARIKKIDTMMISHGDNDHIGGANTIINDMKIKNILTSVPQKFPQNTAQLCLTGRHWRWDGVDFSVLYPFKSALEFGNDSSCVLKIDNGKQRVLLTGDIEKYAENQLLSASPEMLAANLLIAPHHGSKTSSQRLFISAVHPQYVVYSTGYYNRYHFPHSVVVDGYTEEDVLQLNTVDTGAIEFKFEHELTSWSPKNYRYTHHSYWQS